MPRIKKPIRETSKPAWPWWLAVCFLIALSIAGIASTWSEYSATYDEAYHITNGLQWIDDGTRFNLDQPPLGQGAVAYLPHLAGLRSIGYAGILTLYTRGNYRTNLILARMGVLPFFVLASVMVWLWASRLFGKPAGLCATLLFTHLPPVLGHSAIATLDAASAGTIAATLYALLRFLETQSWWRLHVLGAAIALAVVCKFSSFPFLGLCFLGTAIYAVAAKVPVALQRLPYLGGLVFFLVWAGYGFPVTDSVPLMPLRDGLEEIQEHNEFGHGSFLLGEYRQTGWWYFFPVVLAVKTPIGVLMLAAGGALTVLRGKSWQQHLTLWFAVAILLACMTSRINLGVRHILAIYTPLAVLGGYAAWRIFEWARASKPALAAVPIALTAWVVIGAWSARPDYLPYFNELAGAHPERILAESDLDWGQDLDRLSRRLKELGVDHLALKYFGTADVPNSGIPTHTELSPTTPPANGYAAVSVRYLTLENAKDGSYEWLKQKVPQEIIGRSIYLYNFGP